MDGLAQKQDHLSKTLSKETLFQKLKNTKIKTIAV